MATATITTTVVLTDDNGSVFNNTYTMALASTVDVQEFTKSVGFATVENIATLNTTGSGAIADPKRIIIENTDPTNFCTIGLLATGADTVYIKLPAASHMIVSSDEIDANVTGAVFSAFVSVDFINCQFDTAAGIIHVQILGV